MAEESPLPPGSQSLEDGAPPPAETPPAPAAAAPAAVAEPEPESTLDAAGLLAALKAERAEKKAWRERASVTDQLQTYYNETKPYVDFIKQNPDLMRRPAAPSAPVAPTADPDVVEYAELLSLYKADGSGLDLDKAAKALAIAEKRTDRKTAAAIQPYVQQTDQERSARNYHQALNTASSNGVKPDQAALTNLWRSLPAALTADPNVATILQLAATGAAVMGQRAVVAPPPNAPLVSEASGGQPRPRGGPMTELEKRVAAEKGISETKWAELGAGFQAGRGSNLE